MMMHISWTRRRAGAVALVGALGLAALGCGDGTGAVACAQDPPAGAPKRILFIGNSLTFHNGLPYMVRALADSAGQPAPVVDEVALPDFSLEDHWNEGRAARVLRRSCWDVVVLQQGPSSLEESRALLLEYAGRFAALAREQGARPALYSVWPAQTRQGDFTRAIESYALAAQAVDGTLLPAATAWQEAWKRDRTLRLYRDALHPTGEGTYLTALVMVGRLYGADPVGLPPGVGVRSPDGGSEAELRLDPAVARVLQEAARSALALHPEP